MLANDASTLDEDTVADYIKALKKLFVIEDLSAWNPNLRSKAAIKNTNVILMASEGWIPIRDSLAP